MARLRRRATGLLLGCAVATAARGSTAPPPEPQPGTPAASRPAPSAGVPVALWHDEQGPRGAQLFARNDSDAPMRITVVDIYVCHNIRSGCRKWDPEIVLQPGETRRLYTIEPERGSRPYRFGWRADWRAEETR